MANLIVPEDPQFSEEIFELTPQTPAHANEFNSIHKKLFHNTLFLKVKNALLETEIAKAIAIALGRNQALVFNTYDEMVAWFENAENAEKVAALVNGTNLYIIDKDVPDYWWSSVNQQYYELETQKVDLTKYDNILGTNDISGLSEDGTVTGALVKQKQDVDEIYSDLTETKKSVSDGKSSIASAITAKGVTTEADATFETMATNINNLGAKVGSAIHSGAVTTSLTIPANTGKTYIVSIATADSGNYSGIAISGASNASFTQLCRKQYSGDKSAVVVYKLVKSDNSVQTVINTNYQLNFMIAIPVD